MDLTQNELDQLRTAMNAELDRLIAARKPEVKQWPESNDTFFCFEHDGRVSSYTWYGHECDIGILSIGNAFKTRAEAERRVEALKVQAELRRMPGRTAPPNTDGRKCWGIVVSCGGCSTVSFLHSANELTPVCGVFFSSKEYAELALSTIGQGRLQLWLDDYLQTPIE